MTRKAVVLSLTAGIITLGWHCAPFDSSLVIFFGYPIDLWNYISTAWQTLGLAAIQSLGTAALSLTLASLSAIVLLVAGLVMKGWMRPIEKLAATSQVVPFLVVVTLTLLVESSLFALLNIDPPTWVYSVVPVTLALLFPPLVTGAGAIRELPIDIKALLRLWDAPIGWKIRRIYLPKILPAVLTGTRASATWAVGATLIAEGLLNGVSGDSSSLGHYLLRPFSSGAPGRTPAVVLISVLLGFTVYYLFLLFQDGFERRLLGPPVGVEQTYPV